MVGIKVCGNKVAESVSEKREESGRDWGEG